MKYTGPVIDTDVHHTWPNTAALLEYMPKRWRDLVERSGMPLYPSGNHYPYYFGTHRRLDSFPEDGSAPGSNLDLMRKQLFDPYNLERAILSYDGGPTAAHENHYLGAAVATAANDYTIDRWLNGVDDRCYGAVLLSTGLPEEAAKEVRRVGRHPLMVEVLITDGGVGVPFGHPVYHPIYEAAEDLELPVAFHFAANIYSAIAHVSGGGMPMTRMEYYSILNQSSMHHLTSLVTHGVFVRFPRLRFVFVETGINWIPWIFSQLDAAYDLLRRETPWINELPSVVLRSRTKFSTQPMEPAERVEEHVELLRSVEGIDDMLCFATDYPHWDADDLDYVARNFPAEWHEKIFYRNAIDFFRWPAAVPAGV